MKKYYLSAKMIILVLCFQLCKTTFAQVFWTETFSNSCVSDCYANTYVGPNGAWATTLTGVNGSDPNVWYISGAECGNAATQCGSVCGATDPSLHIGSNGTVLGDNGATYLAGGLGFWFPETNVRVESPTINCTGYTNITLAFNYIEFGQGTTDNATLWWNDGSGWALLIDLPKTTCCNPTCGGACTGSTQGCWTAYSALLPASANNNPNVRIGFRWVNNDDNVGTDPSFAVDDITLSVPGGAPPVADFTVNDQTICVGQCVNFTDLSTGGLTSWTWTFTGGTPNSSTVQNPVSICYNTPGTYNVTLVATNAFGSDTETKTNYITVNALPTATAANNGSVCEGGTLTLTGGPNGMTSYSWSGPNSFSSNQQSPTVSNNATPAMAGVYTLTVIDGNGCTDTDTVTVTVTTSLTVTINPSSPNICTGDSITLTAIGAIDYTWSPAAGLSDTTGAIVTASPLNTIIYTVIGTTPSGCGDTTTVTVTVNPMPVASITGDTLVCNGASTILTASGGSTYAWSTSANTQSITVTPVSGTTYTVTVSNAGCSSTTSITINTTLPPTANAGNDTTIDIGGSAQLNGSGGVTYSWSPNTALSCTDCANPVASPLSTTTYVLIATDTNGCTDADTVIVYVDMECGEIFVPNAFSPNKNGPIENELECVYGNCIKTLNFTIYDRWGEKVFETTNPKECWDGTYKGKELNTGVFVYYVKYTLYNNGTEITKQGNISLVR